jgi:cytoskeletal protein CcmA (bactofilin family)
MGMMKRLLFVLTLLFLLSLSVGVVVAAPLNDTIIRAGEEINRDLVVPGGNLLIESGAVVNGNVTVFGGNVTIAGQVNGDVAVFGGNMVLAGDVQGDIALFGGNLTLEEAAVISGDCVAMGGNVSGQGRERVTCTSFRRLSPQFSVQRDARFLAPPATGLAPGSFPPRSQRAV